MNALATTVVAAWRNSPLSRRYEALSGRERLLILVVASLLVLVLLYAVVRELVEFRQSAVALYLSAETDLAWMEENRSKASRSVREGAEPSDRQLSSMVRTTANRFDLQLRRTQAEGDGLGVRIEAASFDRVLRWAHDLETTHGIEITNADIDMHSPGMVNARFSLR